MTDTFEQSLLDIISAFDSKIAAAEERILSDEQLIETANEEKKPFEKMLHAYLQKKKSDSEAMSTFYMSERTDGDIKSLCVATGVSLPEEIESQAAEESDQSDTDEKEIAA